MQKMRRIVFTKIKLLSSVSYSGFPHAVSLLHHLEGPVRLHALGDGVDEQGAVRVAHVDIVGHDAPASAHEPGLGREGPLAARRQKLDAGRERHGAGRGCTRRRCV